MMKLRPDHAAILDTFDKLPDDAIIPVPVTAALFGLCTKTVRERIPSVRISPSRLGNRVGYLRAISRGEKTI
jgi:hypothetical protein